MWNLSTSTKDWTHAPAVEALSLNHWAAMIKPSEAEPVSPYHSKCQTKLQQKAKDQALN